MLQAEVEVGSPGMPHIVIGIHRQEVGTRAREISPSMCGVHTEAFAHISIHDDMATYYLVNGNTSERFGMDTAHAGTNFSCTRPYLLTVDANDNVRFLMDYFQTNVYSVGLNRARFTILKII